MEKKVKILIADDHSIFRHGLKDILETHFPGVTIGEAKTGQEALDQVRQTDWDVVVLDVTMPGRSGVDVLREIRRIHTAPPVLVLSMHPYEQYAARVLKAGATDYITKINAPLEVVEAVKRVLARGKNATSTPTRHLVSPSKTGAEKPLHQQLSNREYQIMRLIPSGKSLKAIAGELSVSVQTVSTHRTRILKKMGMQTNAELIRYAVENDLVD